MLFTSIDSIFANLVYLGYSIFKTFRSKRTESQFSSDKRALLIHSKRKL
jgi:hypothetical protein